MHNTEHASLTNHPIPEKSLALALKCVSIAAYVLAIEVG